MVVSNLLVPLYHQLKHIEMTPYNLEIKVTGSGTPEEIIAALKELAESIEETLNSEHGIAYLDGATWGGEDGEAWEGATLYTEISVV